MTETRNQPNAATSEYPRPELIATTDWLAAHMDDPQVRIVDCDEFVAYQRMHIAGAIGLRTHHYFKGTGDSASGAGIGVHVMDAGKFADLMSSHGIGSDHTVVAYDNSGGVYAARLWWALDYYGHTACRILNGGFRAWYEEGRPVTQDRPRLEPARFEPKPARGDTLCSLSDVRAAIDDPGVVIWDVRSAEEHAGTDDRPNKRHGRIPGAVHMEWREVTAPPGSGTLLPPEEISRRLTAIGNTPDKRVITHCQAGIRAAHGMFLLRLMGYDRVGNYDASWNEWGNRDDTPIEK
jgi:thiosulfate/3-mercaptopyruvate sulfurtransferase